MTSRGPDTAEGIVLVDTWPIGLDAPTGLEPGCAYDAASREVTCHIGTIRQGFTRILLFGARTNAAAAGTLSNTATVDASTFDPIQTNNRETFGLAPA